jgi:DNA repair exonuclease SbcCD ATPase subunit
MGEWKLTIENIGVFRGKHSFTFKEGLNIVTAPNAAGKTSLLKALKLLSNIPEEEAAQYLNDFEEAGSVLLQNSEKFFVSLTRTKEGVKYLKREKLLGDGRAKDVIFVMEGNPLVEYVERGSLENIVDWFRTFTDINRIEVIRDVATNLYRNLRNDYLDKKKVTEATLKEIRKTITELETDLRKINSRIVEILASKEFKEVKTRIDEIHRNIDELENKKAPIKRQITELSADISILESWINEEDEEIKSLSDALHKKQKEQSEGVVRLAQLRSDLDAFKDRLRELERDIRGKPEIGELGLERRVIDLENIIKDREELLTLERCPKCGRPIKKEDVRKELELLKDNLSKLKATLERKKIERNVVQNKILELEAEIKRVTEELAKEIQELQERINYHKKNKAIYIKDLNEKTRKLEYLKLEADDIDKRIDSYRQEEKQIMSSVSKRLLDEYSLLLDEKKQKESQLSLLEQKAISIQKGEKELAVLDKRINVLEQIVQYYNERIQTVKEKMRNELNKSLAEAFELLKLAEFEKIYIDENFELELRRKGGVYTKLDRLSGTERSLVAVIMAFVAKETFFKEIQFFVVDEVTNAMDDTRFRQLIDYIKDKVKVLIVTRNAPLVGEPRILTQEQIVH